MRSIQAGTETEVPAQVIGITTPLALARWLMDVGFVATHRGRFASLFESKGAFVVIGGDGDVMFGFGGHGRQRCMTSEVGPEILEKLRKSCG